MAAAAASLNTQAQELVATVSVFKLSEGMIASPSSAAVLMPARTRSMQRPDKLRALPSAVA
jgi:hypothetical protein